MTKKKLVDEAVFLILEKHFKLEKFFSEDSGIVEEADRLRDRVEKITAGMGVDLTQVQLDEVLIEVMQLRASGSVETKEASQNAVETFNKRCAEVRKQFPDIPEEQVEEIAANQTALRDFKGLIIWANLVLWTCLASGNLYHLGM